MHQYWTGKWNFHFFLQIFLFDGRNFPQHNTSVSSRFRKSSICSSAGTPMARITKVSYSTKNVLLIIYGWDWMEWKWTARMDPKCGTRHLRCRPSLRSVFDWLIDFTIQLSIDCSLDWLIEWVSDRLFDWLIDWFYNPIIHRLLDWLIDWLIKGLIEGLIVRLIDWSSF